MRQRPGMTIAVDWDAMDQLKQHYRLESNGKHHSKRKGGRVGTWAPAHWGLGEIAGLLVPPGETSYLLADHLTTG